MKNVERCFACDHSSAEGCGKGKDMAEAMRCNENTMLKQMNSMAIGLAQSRPLYYPLTYSQK